MRRRQRGRRPFVESMEPRSLLSGGPTGLATLGGATAPGQSAFIHLDGTFRGQYRVSPSIPDTGTTYVAFGSGRVSGVGHADVTARLQSIGFVALGHAQGDLYLAGARGTITLHLTGAEQRNGPQGLPDVFTYTVTGGTGKYSHDHDTGTATYVGIPARTGSGSHATPHGRFTLVLTSNPAPSGGFPRS